MSRHTRSSSLLLLLLLLCAASCFSELTQTRVGGLDVLTVQHEFANAHVVAAPDGRLLLIDSGLERCDAR